MFEKNDFYLLFIIYKIAYEKNLIICDRKCTIEIESYFICDIS